MLGFDKTVTLYNSIFNPETGFNDYYRTVITGVSLHSKVHAVSSTAGQMYSRLFRLRIPEGAICDKIFVPEDDFLKPAEQYTLAIGDIVVAGEGPPAPADGTQWANLLKKRNAGFKIVGYHDNRRIGARHLYVEGA